MSPSVGKIAAAGLVTAALTIVVVAGFLFWDITREAQVAQIVEGHQHVRAHLESLREALHEMDFSVFAFDRTREPAYARDIERWRIEIESLLENLRGKAANHPNLAASLVAIERPARDYLDEALLLLQSTSGIPDREAGAELQRSALRVLKAASERVSGELRDQTLEQAERAKRRESYVLGLLVGSFVVLVGLGIAFRQSQLRARADQARIEHLAHFDALTGLPNRSLLRDRLAQAMALSARNASPLAVLLFDLDGFKGVNDALGHAAGDALLGAAGERAKACMRASDTVGRLGGDEFLAILPDTDAPGAAAVAEKIRERMADPFDLGAERVSVSASIGGGFLPGPASTVDELVHAADQALYASKRTGKNRYTPAVDEVAVPGSAGPRGTGLGG
jgi:diguanylate cyclase (GGDEF)-like protein